MKRFSIILMTAAASLAAMPSVCAQNSREEITVNGVSFYMVSIPSRSFKMGATTEQREDAMPNEYPEHEVRLSGYAIGETEVTQALWVAVMGNNPSLFQANNFPVESISYEDCQRFITRLNSLTGKNFRLPTEAEWEYAARGSAKANKYGTCEKDDYLTSYARIAKNSGMMPNQVGSQGSCNALNLKDMPGNVAEWCSDWMGPYSESTQANPTGPKTGTERVCRGGGWADVPWRCRTSSRASHAPAYKASDLGFRLAMSLSSRSTVYSNPVIKGQKKTDYLQLLSVEITDKATLMSFSYTSYKSGSYCYLNKSTYIKDRRSGKVYPVTDVQGITYEPNRTYVGQGTIEFTLTFPPLPAGVSAIDFIESESSNWNLTEILLQ